MIELKSVEHVSEPKAAQMRENAAARIEEVRATEGHQGSASTAPSRASALLGVGKRDRPLRRARSGLETVLGEDDRQRILETELYPWRMICALRITSPLGVFVGTGWFAGPRTIITAGHCVYHLSDMGGWANEIEVAPGRDEKRTPYGPVTARRFSAVDRWRDTHDPDFDVGCIHLDEALGDETGWFKVTAMPAEALPEWLVNISGYPGDKPDRFDPRAGTQQFYHKNRVLRASDRRVFYDVDTSGGQSGSPVWIQREENGQPEVVGIHAYGVGGTPASFNVAANSAPRIIPELLTLIEGWIAESSAKS